MHSSHVVWGLHQRYALAVCSWCVNSWIVYSINEVNNGASSLDLKCVYSLKKSKTSHRSLKCLYYIYWEQRVSSLSSWGSLSKIAKALTGVLYRQCVGHMTSNPKFPVLFYYFFFAFSHFYKNMNKLYKIL